MGVLMGLINMIMMNIGEWVGGVCFFIDGMEYRELILFFFLFSSFFFLIIICK